MTIINTIDIDRNARIVFADPLTAYAYQIGEAINYATRFDNKAKRDELHGKLMEMAREMSKNK
jgi:hypothetical protein